MYRRILVPTDGSDSADAAATAAIAFARACGSELIALAVAQPEPLVADAAGLAATSLLGPGIPMEAACAYVGRIAQAAARAGVACATLTTRAYSPADEIVDAAGRNGADLVFIGSHGRRGLSRLIAGSVAQQVLARAPVPVMLYRPRLPLPAASSAHPRGRAGADA